MRRSLDPAVAAELEALEAALAGGPDADPALTAFAADVRAVRPAPDQAFLATLDARVANGFARDDAPRAERPVRGVHAPAARRWAVRPRLVALPAAGAALTAVIVAVAVTSQGGDGTSRPAVPLHGTAADTAVAPSATGAGSAAAPAPEAEGAIAPQAKSAAPLLQSDAAAARKVERNTELTLSTSATGLQAAADGVVRVTQSLGGIVQRSQIDRTGAGGTATFSLQIPSARLSDALKALARLAHVTAMSQSTTDITREYSSAASLLHDAQRERAALLRALAKATTAHDVASLHAQLADNRAAIAADKTQLASVSRRADYATVDVTVEGHGHAAAAPHRHRGSTFGPGSALRSAGRVLGAVAGALLVGGAAIAPIALLTALLWLTATTLRRRRRERALDTA